MMEPTHLPPQELTLGDFLEIARRRRWTILQTLAVVAVVGFVATAMMRPVYQAESKLLVQAASAQINAMNTENPLVDLLAMVQPPSVETQIQVLQSAPFIDDVFRRCRVAKTESGVYEPAIRVAAIRDTNVIEVTVESRDRELAARVANTILDEYQDQTRMINLEEIQRARQFVEREAQKSRRELAKAEHDLLLFKSDQRVAELTAEQSSRTQEWVEMDTKAAEAANNITRVQAQIQQVRAALQKEPSEKLVPASRENPRLDVLRGQIADLETQRAGLVQDYQESSPRVVAVDAQLTRLERQLAREPQERRVMVHVLNPAREEMLGRLKGLETEREGLRAVQIQLQSELKSRRERMNQLGPWEIQLAQMNRSRDTAEKQYLMLASKLQDLQIRENARRSMARIIERALPPASPVRPRKAVNLVLSLVLGAIFGLCLAFLQEYLDDRITTPDEVDRLLHLPVLGHIPLMAGDTQRLMTALPPHSPIAESYRSLRSSISFAAIDAPLRTMIVTSSHPGEGKSTTSVNLAIAMALEGRRVILVDADLRRPSLYRVLDLPSAPGLTDVLLGNRKAADALRNTDVAGLRVLTSGPIPPNPAELLNSGPMAALIGELRGMAEIVIFDTPPCLPVTDAQVLAAKVEGVLLVAALGEAKKAEVKHAKELFDRAHARIVGLIFNKISQSTGGYYSAYHRSPYGYGPDGNGQNGHTHALPPVGSRAGGAGDDRSSGPGHSPRERNGS
jgi:succinoglycan biosynthesis transport protein ExoP